MKKILTVFLSILSFALIASAPASAASDCDKNILGIFKPWYSGLVDGTPPNCTIKQPVTESPGSGEITLAQFISTIASNIFVDLMAAVGILCVFMIIYGGFLYVTSSGDEAKMKTARRTLTGAIVGVAISVSAVFIFNQISSLLPEFAANARDDTQVIRKFIDLFLSIVGGLSAIMIVVSGLKMATSGGNESKVASAKKTLIGAIIGLAIAVFSGVIVSIIFANLSKVL